MPDQFARKRIVIAGAGLSGLTAAYLLVGSGNDVTILEGQHRPGGRVLTIREPFSDSLYAEAGAVLFSREHTFTTKYVKQFDLPSSPAPPRSQGYFRYIRGKRVELSDENSDWSLGLDLTAEEKKLGIAGMTEKYIGSVVRDVGDPRDPGWPAESLKKYDHMSFAEFLHRQGASTDAIELMRLSSFLDFYGDGIDTISALFLLRQEAHTYHTALWHSIRGGNDLLPKAFATRLADRIHYGAAVVRVEQDPRSVRTTFLQGGASKVLEADHLACTMPFSVLKDIEFSPTFSPEKRRAIEELPHISFSRVYLQFRTRFWSGTDMGWSYSGLPIGWVRDASFNQEGQRGILEAFSVGRHARRLTRLSDAERIEFTLQHMETLFPQNIRDHFEIGTSKCWDEDRWELGDCCWAKPGQMTSIYAHISPPEGRVHFAGDHTSAEPGWMNGAIDSGERVAREIDRML